MANVRTAIESGLGDTSLRALPGAAMQEQRINIPAGSGGLPGADAAKEFGKGAMDLADGLQRVQLEQDALLASKINEEYTREVLDAQYNPESGFLAQQGANTIGLKDKAQERLAAIRAKYGEQAAQGGDRVSRLFDKSASSTELGVLESVERHSLTQQDKWRDERAQSEIKLRAEQIGLDPANDDAFAKYKGQMQSAALAQARADGASEEKLNLILKQSGSLAEETRATQMMRSDDPNTIIRGNNYFEKAKAEGLLTLDSVNKLESLQREVLPKALARNALPGVVSESGDFTQYTPEQIFNRGMLPQESGGKQFDPKTGLPLTSPKGAIGIAQVMPETAPEAARLAGLEWDEEKYKTDKVYNAALGQAYFSSLVKKYGNNTLAVMAYNAGPGAMDDFINGTNETGKNAKHLKLGDPSKGNVSMEDFIAAFPFQETRNYVQAVQRRAGVQSGKADYSLALVKAQELEKQYPGAGQTFLTQINQRNAEIEKAQAQANATFLSDFTIALNRGQKTYADIEDAYQRALITPEQRTGFVKQLDEFNHNTLKDAEAAGRVQGALNGTAILDPKRSEDKKAVDLNYRAWAQNVLSTGQIQDEETLVQAQLGLIQKYGMVPETMQGNLRGGLRSANPQKKVMAADMIDKLRQLNPALLNDFADEDIADALNIRAYTEAGFSPEDAVNRVVEAQKMTPDLKKARTEEFKEEIKKTPAKDLIKGALTTWKPWNENYDNHSDIPTHMEEDFKRLAEAEYIRSGNMNSAAKLGAQLIQKTWASSGVGSFRVDEKDDRGFWMKQAPELYYKAPDPSLSSADQSLWMRKQLLQDMAREDSLSGKPIKGDDVTLTVSPYPAPDGRPTYNVWYRQKGGGMVMFGGPDFTWHPHWEGSKEQKAMLKERVEVKAGGKKSMNFVDVVSDLGGALMIDPKDEKQRLNDLAERLNR